MRRNVAGQKVGAQVLTTAGAAFTSAVTVYVTKDAGTQAVGSVGSGACTHEGNGYHTYSPAQGETDGNLVAFTFIGTGASPVTVQYDTEPHTILADPTSGLAQIYDLVNSLDADATLAPETMESISDTILGRNIAGGGNGTKTVRQALQKLRNKWTISGGVATFYAADGTTVSFTSNITTSSGAIVSETPTS